MIYDINLYNKISSMRPFGVLLLILVTTVTAQNSCIDGNIDLIQDEGSSEIVGYVRYCWEGQWRSVCRQQDFNWNDNEARVACRQLGYQGQGAGSLCPLSEEKIDVPVEDLFIVTLCNATLNGMERSLQDCTLMNTTSCLCGKIARLRCDPVECVSSSLRLVGGASEREGRVEVCVDGRWGTVQTNNPGELAQTVCQSTTQSLEFYSTASCYVSQFGDINSKPVYNCNDKLICTEVSNSHESDLAVVCRITTDPDLILRNSPCHTNEEGSSFRLLGGSSYREGRVEVCVGGCWGTVCNNNDEEIAELICEQLGFPRKGSSVLSSRVFDGVRGYNCTSDVSTNLTCEETSCALALAVRCSTTFISVCSDSRSSLTAGIVILVLILLATFTGWIVTFVVFAWRKSIRENKKEDTATTFNESYSFHHPRQLQQPQQPLGQSGHSGQLENSCQASNNEEIEHYYSLIVENKNSY